MSCPLCGGADLQLFLERREVPVLLNAPQPDRVRAAAIPRGDLRLFNCRACGFLHNAAFDPERILYAQDYLNNQEHSPQFSDYLGQVVARQGGAPQKVLEIGCGRGAFLQRLCAESGVEGWGFDTTYEGSARVGSASFFRARYEGGMTFDRVISRHVLEHVPQPLQLLRLARSSLPAGGRLFVEVPDLGWILKNLAFWDFFYEHVNYFSPSTLCLAAQKAGFREIQVTAAFGGQYLWLEAAAGEEEEPVLLPLPLLDFQVRSAQKLGYWARRLGDWSGKVALWGAGAKGVSFANLLDPRGLSITCLIDIHPQKQGLFIPASAHPVLSPEILSEGRIEHLIVTNPNYLGEIKPLALRLCPSLHIHVL